MKKPLIVASLLILLVISTSYPGGTVIDSQALAVQACAPPSNCGNGACCLKDKSIPGCCLGAIGTPLCGGAGPNCSPTAVSLNNHSYTGKVATSGLGNCPSSGSTWHYCCDGYWCEPTGPNGSCKQGSNAEWEKPVTNVGISACNQEQQ